jgi:hypothetical protein
MEATRANAKRRYTAVSPGRKRKEGEREEGLIRAPIRWMQ